MLRGRDDDHTILGISSSCLHHDKYRLTCPDRSWDKSSVEEIELLLSSGARSPLSLVRTS